MPVDKDTIRLKSDPCTYIRRIKDELEIITVWVDDMLLFTTTERSMFNLKAELRSLFEITDMGEPVAILKSEGMQDANPVSTPLDPNIKLEVNPVEMEGNRSNAYAMLLGKLQYLATATRPDIAYAVNRLASYTANPSLIHYTINKYQTNRLSMAIPMQPMPTQMTINQPQDMSSWQEKLR